MSAVESKDSQYATTERIRLALTNEGWIYLIILLFVASGGLLRNINLLILLNGLMAAPLLVGWRLCVIMLRNLKLRRSVPKMAFAQRPVDIIWEIKNERRSMASWQVVVNDNCQPIEKRFGWQRPLPIRILFPLIRPNETVFQQYRILFEKRGQYQLTNPVISTNFPFGIINTSCKLDETALIHVAPPVGKLIASWDRRLLSRATGFASMKRKRDMQDEEFFALRTWRSGDSLKQIHWRTTAKYSTPMVKQNDTRTDKDFVLTLDLFESESNERSSSSSNDLELVLEFASTVFLELQNSLHGQISVAICGSEGELLSDHIYSRVAPDVFRSLAMARGSANPPTLEAIAELGKQASQGTPIYVISTREFPIQLLGQLPEDARARFRIVEPWLRWLPVGSPEFKDIFKRHENFDKSAFSIEVTTKNVEAE